VSSLRGGSADLLTSGVFGTCLNRRCVDAVFLTNGFHGDHWGANVGLEVFYSSMQTIPDEIPVSLSITRGFMILVVFFLGLL
jgi:hypothetical protein